MNQKVSRIGVVLDSLRRPTKEALSLAARLGLGKIEMSAAAGEVDPDRLSRTGRRHLSRYVENLGLALAALGADEAGGSLTDPTTVERLLDKTRKIMELAAELRVPQVTRSLGRLDRSTLEKGLVPEAVQYLAELADRTGTRVAIQTAGGDPQLLRELLDQVDSPLVGVCYDPAALVIEGRDGLSAMEPLADRLMLARVSDGVPGAGGRPGYETALGRGQVDLAAYLGSLAGAGYAGALLIRRLHAERPIEEIEQARDRLRSLLR